MAHKTLISGTAYSVTGGRDLIGGTGYDCKAGKTLINGTAFEVRFAELVTINISKDSSTGDSSAYIIHNGVQYSSGEIEVEVGDTIICSIPSHRGKGSLIIDNKTIINGASVVSYSYVVESNIQIYTTADIYYEDGSRRPYYDFTMKITTQN
jgi:hypothetical protein